MCAWSWRAACNDMRTVCSEKSLTVCDNGVRDIAWFERALVIDAIQTTARLTKKERCCCRVKGERGGNSNALSVLSLRLPPQPARHCRGATTARTANILDDTALRAPNVDAALPTHAAPRVAAVAKRATCARRWACTGVRERSTREAVCVCVWLQIPLSAR